MHTKSGLLTAALLMAAPLMMSCAGGRVATFDGAEILSPQQPPRIATARVLDTNDPRPALELRSADGQLYAGRLALPTDPIPGPDGVVPLAAPVPGGVLVGQLLPAGGGAPLDCRFAVLNPPRGLDGGGTGTCLGASGRRVDFVF